MSQHEYSVNLAKAKTREELLALAKEFLEKEKLKEPHPPKPFRDTSNGE